MATYSVTEDAKLTTATEIVAYMAWLAGRHTFGGNSHA